MQITGKRIVVISEGARQGYAAMQKLRDSGFELVEHYDVASSTEPASVANALQGAWGVIAGGVEPYSAEVFGQAPDLRVIARPGVGYDMIDVSAATRRRIAVFTTPGANEESVADFTLTLILASLERLLLADNTVRSGGWRPPGLSRELFRATVGIVGLGRIGRAVARRLAAFECRVIAVEPTPDLDFCRRWNVELTSMATMLPQVDVLTVHAVLSSKTQHLIGRSELAQLKFGAIVVNTARGGVIDEAALVDALKTGRVGGAGLDVFECEPLPMDHALRGVPNIVLSGHVAAFTDSAIHRMMAAVGSGLLKVAAGKAPPGCLNPEVFAHP